MTDVTTDPRYEWWRLALEGRAPQAVIDDPQCGYYSTGKGERREPVAIFIHSDDGEITVTLGFGMNFAHPEMVWPQCYANPITEEVYWDTVDNRRWADLDGIVKAKPVEDPAAVPFGSNRPADIDPLEEITEEVDAAIKQLDSVLPKPGETVKDKTTADRIANSKDRLRELWKKADGQRVIEKKPHDEAVAAVQARWKPLVEAKVGRIAAAGERAEAALAAHLKWVRAEQARIEREAEEARQAEERRRQAEHDAAVAEAAKNAAPPPPPPEPVAAPPPLEKPRVGGGLSGKRTGLKATNYRATIVDYDKALAFFAGTAKVRETVQALADALARSAAHTAAPGCEVIHDEGTT